MKAISSAQNPLVKDVRKLARGAGRDRERFLVEGSKLAREALAAPVAIEQALLSRTFFENPRAKEILRELEAKDVPSTVIGGKLFASLSALEAPEGVLLVVRKPDRTIASAAGDILAVAAGVQDPGNLGALARVAEAAGAAGLVVCEGTADPFQLKSMRGAMGSLFRLPVWGGGSVDAVHAALKKKGFRTVASVPRAGISFRSANLASPVAIFFGSEGHGLPSSLELTVDLRVAVPMKTPVESLNVAVVAGLLLYEAARQKGRKGHESHQSHQRKPIS